MKAFSTQYPFLRNARYLLAIVLLLSGSLSFGQTTENYNGAGSIDLQVVGAGQTPFDYAGFTYQITGVSVNADNANIHWQLNSGNGSTADIAAYGGTGSLITEFKIKKTDGGIFDAASIWLLSSGNAFTITGYVDGGATTSPVSVAAGFSGIKTLSIAGVDELRFVGTMVEIDIDDFNYTLGSPSVTSLAVSSITASSAIGNGNITDLGKTNPSQHGVCWNTSGTPTIGDSKTTDGGASSTGAFTSSIGSLTSGTTYYVRAYATNTSGTGYGIEVSFTTLGPEMAVKGNNVEIPDGDATPATADHTDFGSIDINAAPFVRTFTIENTGDALLSLGANAVSLSGSHAADYTVSSQPATTVAVSGSTTFNISFNPSVLGVRTADISIANDDGDENPYNFAISGTRINAAPTISINDATLAFTEEPDFSQINADPIKIDASATLSDVDGDADWNGGKLEIQITANAESTDEISIPDNEGGTINTSGSDIKNGSTIIGTLSHSEGKVTNDTKLTITFNSSATNALVQDVLRAIHYRSTSDDPGTLNRTVTFTATDNGAESVSDTRTISVTAKDDAPIFSATRLDPTFTEDGSAAVVFSSTSASTIESGQTLSAFTITVTSVNDGASEILNVDGKAIALTNGSGATTTKSLDYSVSVSGTLATITLTGGTLSTSDFQTLIDAITYQNNSNTPNTSNRVVGIHYLTDSGLGTDNNVNQNEFDAAESTVTVVAANDAPTLTGFASVIETTTENNEIEITFSELKAQGNEADVDGTVDAFIVKALSTGTLKIGANSGAATAFHATTNKTIDATNNAYWTPANNASGILNAFTTTVLDNNSAESTGAVQATLTVNDVTAPLLVSSIPSDNASNAILSGDIVLNFDDDMVAGTGNITIRRLSDDTAFEQIAIGDARISIASSQITLNPTGTLAKGVGYYIEIDATALDDDGGNSFAGISGNSILNFTAVDVVINEVATDPQQDWSTNGFNGTVDAGAISSGTDEWLELLINSDGIDFTGWTLELLDGTNIAGDLSNTGAFDVSNYLGSGSFENTISGDYLVLGNVDGTGAMNNSGLTINLKDPGGATVDAVVIGGGVGQAPLGDANGYYNATVQRYTNGLDTDVDSDDFTLGMASMGSANIGPSVFLSVSSPITEASGVSTITATLSAASSQNVTITLAVDGSSTAAPADYALSSSSIVINAGSTTGTATITATQDQKDENDETVIVNITDVVNGIEAATQQKTVTITDDDTAGFTLSKLSASVDESGTTDSFTVVLDAQPTSDVVLNIVSGDESEVTVSSATLTFTSENWDSVQTVTLTGIDDNLADGDKSTSIIISVDDDNSDNVFDPVANQTLTCTTIDDEEVGFTVAETDLKTIVSETGTTDAFSVVLKGKPASNVVLSVVSGDTDEAVVNKVTLTFTPANWNILQSVTVTGVDDILVDGLQTTAITIAVVDASSDDAFDVLSDQSLDVTTTDSETPGITIVETHGSTIGWEAGKIDTIWVTLNAPPATDVVLSFARDYPSEMDIEWDEYTFTPDDWDDPHDFLIAGMNDNIVDGDKTVALTIGVVDGKSDDAYDSLEDIIINAINIDNEVASFSVPKMTATVDESGTTDSFTVVLDKQPVSNVVFNVSSGDTDEVTVDQAVLTFTNSNWNTPQTVVVTGVNDDLADGSQTTNVTISVDTANSQDEFDALADKTVSVTTADDDANFTISKSTASVAESGTTDSFTAVLNAQPLSNVVLSVVSGDENEATVDQATLTFTVANWDSPQTVTITGANDNLVDGNQSTNIIIGVDDASSADAYDGAVDQTLACITTDDDDAGFTLVELDGSTTVSESGSTDSFTAVLNAQPVSDVVLKLVSGDTGEATVDLTILTFTNSNWNTPQTVTVTGIDDDLVDGEQSTTLTISVDAANSDDAFDALPNKTVEVSTTDVDVSPVVTASQTFSVDEDAVNTASVGTVLATDGNAGTTFSSWTITSGNDDAIFAINSTSGKITVADNSNLDFEVTTSYTLSVKVSDGVNTSSVETVSVNVNDINDELPVVTASQSFSVDEDALNDASVGTVLVNDADAGTSYSVWTITSGNDDAIFAINSTSGKITVADNSNLDFETTTSYALSVTVSDGVNTSSVETVSVNVNDINDELPVVTALQSFAVNETAANTASVGNVLVNDADAGTTYSSWIITSGNDDAIFAINPTSGIITVADNANLDFETTTSYALSVTVSDGVNTSSVETVSVNVNDINDELPVVTALQSFAVNETAANTASVGTVLVNDADAGTTFSNWTITEGNGDGIFAINPSSGEITLADNANLDFESTNSYSLLVTVSDGVNTSSVETVSVNINDINDEVPVVIASQTFNIDEDEPNTTSLGTVLATDGDVTGTTFSSWAITSGNTNNVFVINSSTGEITVNDANELDYEIITSYTLSVKVGDGVNTSSVETVTVDVNDINDEVPVITASQSFAINETAVNAASVGMVLVNDADAGTTYSSWTITSGNDDGIFIINLASGQITVADNSNLDFESTTSYTLSVTVSDGVNTSFVETVSVNVNDINDEVPVIIASQSFSVKEDADNNTSIGTVLVSDADARTTFSSWKITSGNDDAIFAISPTSGEIFIDDNSHLSFMSAEVYNLSIRVSDGLNVSKTELVTVLVDDVNEFAPVVLESQNFYINENSKINKVVGKVSATDIDSASEYSNWEIVEGNEGEAFHFNQETGELLVKNGEFLDYESSSSYELWVNVSDGMFTSESQLVIIYVRNVNERPIANAGRDQLVADNSKVTLNAWDSVDPEGDELAFKWSAPEGIELSDVHDPMPTFMAPDVSALTDYVFTLVVDDGELYSEEVSVTISIDNVTGIEEIDSEKVNVSLYPNPSKGAFYLELNKRPVNPATLSIISLSGQAAYSQELYEKKTFFNLSLKSGMYILKIGLDDKIIMKKIIIH